MKLTIKEIADLKEGRITLNEITKTHDGTSLGGKLGILLDKWTEEVGGKLKPLNHSILDNEGYGVEYDLDSAIRESRRHGDDPEMINGDWHKIVGPEKFHWANDREIINMEDIVRISESGYTGSELGDLWIPNEKQIMEITTKDDNGEYLMRGEHVVSSNYTRMSIIRKDSFNVSDEETLQKVASDFNNASLDYKKQYETTYKENYEKISEQYNKDSFPITFNGQVIEYTKDNYDKFVSYKVRTQTINDIGTFEQNVLKDQKFYDKFEKCNTKFRVSRKLTKEDKPFSQEE